MAMPIRDRRYFIFKHNEEAEEQTASMKNVKSTGGKDVNQYALNQMGLGGDVSGKK